MGSVSHAGERVFWGAEVGVRVGCRPAALTLRIPKGCALPVPMAAPFPPPLAALPVPMGCAPVPMGCALPAPMGCAPSTRSSGCRPGPRHAADLNGLALDRRPGRAPCRAEGWPGRRSWAGLLGAECPPPQGAGRGLQGQGSKGRAVLGGGPGRLGGHGEALGRPRGREGQGWRGRAGPICLSARRPPTPREKGFSWLCGYLGEWPRQPCEKEGRADRGSEHGDHRLGLPFRG